MGMATKTKEIRGQIDDERFRKNSVDTDIWKPRGFNGKIRVMPLYDDTDNWNIFQVEHRERPAFDADNPKLVCPDPCGVPCPVEKTEDKAKRLNDAVSLEFLKVVHECRSRQWLMRIVVVEEDGDSYPADSQGREGFPRRFYCAQTGIMNDLVAEMEAGYNFWDPEEGYDIILRDNGRGKGYSARCVKQATALPNWAEIQEFALKDKEYYSEADDLERMRRIYLKRAEKQASRKGKGTED